MSRRRKRRQLPRSVVYSSALQKLWRHQVPTPAEARELRRNKLPDGSYPLVPLVRPTVTR